VANLLSDRPDGVLLLGSAVRAAAGISKLHELFRLFENAFGCGGIRLTEPLTAFLQGATRTSGRYTKSEIKMWINELRHPATHADLQKSKRVAYDPEIEPYLYRIEQAAYDVLFNKADWGAPGYARKNRWSFSAIVNQDGSFVVSPGATFRTSTPLDHFQAFPLAEVARLSLSTPNDDWLMGDWYFSEEDWQSFKVKD
jgi:hypothetical protein